MVVFDLHHVPVPVMRVGGDPVGADGRRLLARSAGGVWPLADGLLPLATGDPHRTNESSAQAGGFPGCHQRYCRSISAQTDRGQCNFEGQKGKGNVGA